MGREQLQGTPWHEEQMYKTCKDGSKYCVYNKSKFCACTASEYYKQPCVGKGLCMMFEPKTGTPKVISEKTIIIKQNPHNSKIEKEHKINKHASLRTIKVKQYEYDEEVDLMDANNMSNLEDEEENIETPETPEERFTRVSLNRIKATTEDLRRISNLSNKSRYSYSEEQIDKMFCHIDRAVQNAKDAFKDEGFIEEFKW